ncbi:MAG: sulfite exporter TauE/SafE family protein, partial [Candidatus Omnitrophota bacterium]
STLDSIADDLASAGFFASKNEAIEFILSTGYVAGGYGLVSGSSISFGSDLWGGKSYTVTVNSNSFIYANRVFYRVVIANTTGYDAFGSSYTTNTITTNEYKTLSQLGVDPVSLGLSAGADPLVLANYTVKTDSTSNDIFGGTVISKSSYTYTNSVVTDNSRPIWGLKAGNITANVVVIGADTHRGSISVGTDLWGAKSVTKTDTTYIIYANRALAKEVKSTTTGFDAFGSSYTTITTTKNNYKNLTVTLNGKSVTAYVVDSYTVKTLSKSEDIFGGSVYSYSNLYHNNDKTSYSGKEYFGLKDVHEASSTLDSIADDLASAGFFASKNEAIEFILSTGYVAGGYGVVSGSSISFGSDLWGGKSYTVTVNSNSFIYANRVFYRTVVSTTKGFDTFGSSYTSATTTTNNYLLRNLTINGEKVRALVLSSYRVDTFSSTRDIFGGDVYSFSNALYRNNIVTENGRQIFGLKEVVYKTYSLTELKSMLISAGFTESEAVSFLGQHGIKIGGAITFKGSIAIGTDIFGAKSVTLTTYKDEDLIKHANRPFYKNITSVTKGFDAFGSSYTSTTVTTNNYGKLSEAQKLGLGITADPFVLLDYAVKTDSASNDISGGTVTSQSSYTYTNDVVTEDVSRPIWGLKAGNITPNEVTVTIDGVEYKYNGSVSVGTDLWGGISVTKTDTVYIVSANRAFAKDVTSETTGFDAFGSSYTSTTVTTNNYGKLSETDKLALGITTDPMVLLDYTVKADSSSDDIFGGTVISQSNYTYKNSVVTDNLRPIWGLSANVTPNEVRIGDDSHTGSISVGTDLWGGRSVTKTDTLSYIVYANRAMAVEVRSTTIGYDAFGSNYTTNSTTINNYGKLSEAQKLALGITTDPSVLVSYTVDTITTNIDVFGGMQISLGNTTYYNGVETQIPTGKKYWGVTRLEAGAIDYDRVKALMVTSGIAIDDAEAQAMLSRFGINSSSDFKVNGELAETVSIGFDLWGQLSITGSVTTEWLSAAGQFKPVDTESVTLGGDMFGSSYTSTTTTHNEYSQIDWDIKGVNVKVWALIESYSKTITQGRDVSGNTYNTTGGIYNKYGRSVVGDKTIWAMTEAKEGYMEVLERGSGKGERLNQIGLYSRWVDGSVTTGSDIFGNIYTSTTHNTTYKIYANRAFVEHQETTSVNTNLDGSASTTESKVDYGYEIVDGIFQLTGALGSSVTKGQDVFGNTYTTTTINKYQMIKGRAVVSETFTVSENESLDGSTSYSFSRTGYDYDIESVTYGKVTKSICTTTNMKDLGISVTDEIDVNGAKMSIWNYLVSVCGFNEDMLKLVMDNTTSLKSGSIAVNKDIFGNITASFTHNNYIRLANGQWRPLDTKTLSRGMMLDGSLSITISASGYDYGSYTNKNGETGEGILTGMHDMPVKLSEDNPFGTSGSWYDYIANVFGSDALREFGNVTEYVDAAVPHATDTLNRKGLLDNIPDGDNDGDIDADDYAIAHGYASWNSWVEAAGADAIAVIIITEWYIAQGYDKNNDGQITSADFERRRDAMTPFNTDIRNLASDIEDWDGTYEEVETNMFGRLLFYEFSGSFTMGSDVFGNMFATTTNNIYTLLANGQVKAETSKAVTYSQSLDGSYSTSEQSTTYTYTTGDESVSNLDRDNFARQMFGADSYADLTEDQKKEVDQYFSSSGKAYAGLLIHAEGTGSSDGRDIMGNKMTSTSTMSYVIIGGKPLVDESITDSSVQDPVRGETSSTRSVMKYVYSYGNESVQSGVDANGNTYYIIGDNGVRMYIAEGVSLINPETNKAYKGLVIGVDPVSTVTVTTGNDTIGNTFTSIVTSTYIMIDGKLKVEQAVTETTTAAIDTAVWDTQVITTTVNYTYTFGAENENALAQGMFNKDYSQLDDDQKQQVAKYFYGQGSVWRGLLKHADGAIKTIAYKGGEVVIGSPMEFGFDQLNNLENLKAFLRNQGVSEDLINSIDWDDLSGEEKFDTALSLIFLGKFLKANGLDYSAISQKYGWDRNTTFEQKVDNIISEIPFGSIFGLEFTLVRNMDGQISFVTKASLKDYLMNAAIDIKFSEEISLNNMTRAALEKIFDMVIAGSDDPTGTITFEIIAGQAKVKEQHETLLVLTIGSNGERCYVVNETRVTNYYNAITGELEKTVTDFRRNGKAVENLYDINQFMADMGWDPIAVMEYYNSHKGEGNKLTNDSPETMWLEAVVLYAFKDVYGNSTAGVTIRGKDGSIKEYYLTKEELVNLLWGGKVKLSNDIILEALTSEITINLNEQTITERTDSKYSNGQLISYDEKIWSSATPSIWTYYEHRNIKYKLVTLANGVTVWKIKSQDIKSWKIGAEYTAEAWAKLSDQEKARIIAAKKLTSDPDYRAYMDYYGFEKAVKLLADYFIKSGTDLSEIPGINTSEDPTVIYQEDLEYDEYGRLIGYTEMITEGTLVTINKVSNITYNEYGQIIARKTETWKNDTASSPETRGEGRSRLRNMGTGRGNPADVSAESPLNQHYITYEGASGEDAGGNLILEKDGKDFRMKYNAFGQMVYSYSSVSAQKFVDGSWVWEGVEDGIHLHPITYYSEKTFFYNDSGAVVGIIERGIDPEARLPYFNMVTYKYNSAGEIVWTHTMGYRYDSEKSGYIYENGNIIEEFTTSKEWLIANCTIGETDESGKRAIYYNGAYLGYVYGDDFDQDDDYVTFGYVRGTYDPEDGTKGMTQVWFDTVQIDMSYNSKMKLVAFREGGTVNGYGYYFQRWDIAYNSAGQVTSYYQRGSGSQGGSGSSLKDLREQNGKGYDLTKKEYKYDINGDVIGTSGWYINEDGDRVDQSATIKIERDKTTGVIVKITTVSYWETDDFYGGQTDTTTFSYNDKGIRIGQAEATSNKWDGEKWTLGRILTMLAIAIAGIVTGILTAGTTSPLLASVLASFLSVSAAVTIATIVTVAFFVALATTLTSYLANSIRFGFDKAKWDMFLQDFLKSWAISIVAQGVGYGLGATMDWIGGAGEAAELTAEAATVTIGDMILKGLLTASVTTLILWAINGFDKNFFKDLNFGQVFIIALATILSVSTNVIEQTMEVLKDIYNSTLGAVKDALGLNENLAGAWQAGKLSFFGLLEKAFYRAVFQTLEDYVVDRLTREPGGSGTALVFSMIWNYQGDQKGWYKTESGGFVFVQTTPLLGSMAFLRSAGILIIASLGNLFEKLNENKDEPRKSDWKIRLFRNLASEAFDTAFGRIDFDDSVDENLGTMVSSGYMTDDESGEKVFARVYVKEDKETGAKNKTVIITSSKESQDIKEYRTSGTEGGKEKYVAHTQSNLKNMILYVLNTLGVDQEKMIALNGEDLEISTSSISS